MKNPLWDTHPDLVKVRKRILARVTLRRSLRDVRGEEATLQTQIAALNTAAETLAEKRGAIEKRLNKLGGERGIYR